MEKIMEKMLEKILKDIEGEIDWRIEKGENNKEIKWLREWLSEKMVIWPYKEIQESVMDKRE